MKKNYCHKVNIFHLISLYRFFHLSCENCKLKTHCEPIKRESKECEIAKDAKKLFELHIVGHVSSFDSDDFYIKPESKNIVQQREIKKSLSKMWSKYAVKTK